MVDSYFSWYFGYWFNRFFFLRVLLRAGIFSVANRAPSLLHDIKSQIYYRQLAKEIEMKKQIEIGERDREERDRDEETDRKVKT